MESRVFIGQAKALQTRIKDFATLSGIMSEEANRAEDEAIQKQITALFNGLQNPTLPSALNLRDTVLRCGWAIDPRKLHLLAQAEQVWN